MVCSKSALPRDLAKTLRTRRVLRVWRPRVEVRVSAQEPAEQGQQPVEAV
jgi:hypothetical protein